MPRRRPSQPLTEVNTFGRRILSSTPKLGGSAAKAAAALYTFEKDEYEVGDGDCDGDGDEKEEEQVDEEMEEFDVNGRHLKWPIFTLSPLVGTLKSSKSSSSSILPYPPPPIPDKLDLLDNDGEIYEMDSFEHSSLLQPEPSFITPPHVQPEPHITNNSSVLFIHSGIDSIAQGEEREEEEENYEGDESHRRTVVREYVSNGSRNDNNKQPHYDVEEEEEGQDHQHQFEDEEEDEFGFFKAARIMENAIRKKVVSKQQPNRPPILLVKKKPKGI